jgi:hypothetical protein
VCVVNSGYGAIWKLTDPEQKSIRTETSTSVNCFAVGQRMRATRCVILPYVLAGKAVKVKTDAVDSNR